MLIEHNRCNIELLLNIVGKYPHTFMFNIDFYYYLYFMGIHYQRGVYLSHSNKKKVLNGK